MIRIMQELNAWLENHNLPSEGIRMTLEFPRSDMAYWAKSALDQEIAKLSYAGKLSQVLDVAQDDTQICGVVLDFTSPDKRPIRAWKRGLGQHSS